MVAEFKSIFGHWGKSWIEDRRCEIEDVRRGAVAAVS
jgi:hypothetical protein